MQKRSGGILSRLVSGSLGGLRDALEKLIDLPRNIKQACLLLLDMVFVSVAMYAAVALRYGHFKFNLGPIEISAGIVTLIVSAIIFLRLGLYRAVIRFMGQQAIWAIITAVSYSTLVLGAVVFFTRAEVPRSTPFIYWVLAMLAFFGLRMDLEDM